MKNRYLLAIAAVCAITIVSTESQAQNNLQAYHAARNGVGMPGNVIINNNNWNGGNRGWGWQQPNQTYNYNCTGCYAGSGPYDSNIAVTGIGAAAGIIGALIQNNRPAPQAPPVVIYAPQPGQPQPIVVYPQGQNVSR